MGFAYIHLDDGCYERCNKPRKVWYAVHEGFHVISQLEDLMAAADTTIEIKGKEL